MYDRFLGSLLAAILIGIGAAVWALVAGAGWLAAVGVYALAATVGFVAVSGLALAVATLRRRLRERPQGRENHARR
jgi:membrane protein implicated in regulation of membrane protease activity